MTPTTAMQSNPAISLIVPVYNVGAYLEDGLQSLLQQDFAGNYEVIVVDDGSTDNSLAICRDFAAKHADKFRLIESPANAGVSNARNLGLAEARGDYLMFVDPDDILPPSALGDMYEAAQKEDADIVKGNLLLFNEQGRRRAPDYVDRRDLVRGDDVLTTLYEHARVRGHVGGKLFRRDRFGELRFTLGVRMAQDLLYFSEMFARADSLLLLDRDVYLYRKHSTGSTGRKYAKGSYADWLNSVERCGDFARSAAQRRAHKGLLLRTLVQIARECRRIDAEDAATVLQVIEQKCAQWQMGLSTLLFRDRLSPRDLTRYFKLRLALRQVRANLAEARA